MMTEKTRERLYWITFVIFLWIAVISGLNLAITLTHYLLNK